MPYYLSGYVGAGSRDNPYRPAVTSPGWSSIDLRPDPTAATGWCLVHTPQPVSPLPSGVVDLQASGPRTGLPNAIRNQLQNRLGVTLDGTALADVVAELLTVHGGLPGRWGRLVGSSIHLGGMLWEAP